jgi:hypothetical protein
MILDCLTQDSLLNGHPDGLQKTCDAVAVAVDWSDLDME